MPQGIFVSTTSTGAGKSLVSLGLADSLYRRSGTVGYFRPVVPGDDVETDPMVLLMREQYGLSPEQARGGLTAAEARTLMAEGRGDEVQQLALRARRGERDLLPHAPWPQPAQRGMHRDG